MIYWKHVHLIGLVAYGINLLFHQGNWPRGTRYAALGFGGDCWRPGHPLFQHPCHFGADFQDKIDGKNVFYVLADTGHKREQAGLTEICRNNARVK